MPAAPSPVPPSPLADPRVQPRKRPRQARSRALVAAILQATARVLVREGYAGTTTNRVAEVAGVSIGSLYQYFPTKEALVAALHEEHGREMAVILRAALPPADPERGPERGPERERETDLRAALTALVAAVLRAHLLDPALHRVLEYEFPLLDRFAGYAVPDGELHRALTALLLAHADRLARPPTPRLVDMLIHTTHAAIHAVALAPVPPAGPEIAEAIRDITDLVMGYLSYPPGGRGTIAAGLTAGSAAGAR